MLCYRVCDLRETNGQAAPPTPRTGLYLAEFEYPRLGPGQMWERCADRVTELGGHVLLNHRVTTIEVEGNRAVAVTADTPSGPRLRQQACDIMPRE